MFRDRFEDAKELRGLRFEFQVHGGYFPFEGDSHEVNVR